MGQLSHELNNLEDWGVQVQKEFAMHKQAESERSNSMQLTPTQN